MVRILTAQDGGMPFEILAATVTTVNGPYYVPVTFDSNGTKTKASVAGADTQLTPFTNPVTGDEHEVHTVLPDGFVWTDGLIAEAKKNVVDVEGVAFDWSGQNAYFAKINWSNEELHEGAKTKF